MGMLWRAYSYLNDTVREKMFNYEMNNLPWVVDIYTHGKRLQFLSVTQL